MPHIIVKIYPGRTEEQKHRLAGQIVEDVVAIAGCEEKSVSVAIEEVRPEEWTDKVVLPEIVGRQELLYIQPGYSYLTSAAACKIDAGKPAMQAISEQSSPALPDVDSRGARD